MYILVEEAPNEGTWANTLLETECWGVGGGAVIPQPWTRSVVCVSLASSSLEKAMAPHSSTVAWKIPWTEEPGRL